MRCSRSICWDAEATISIARVRSSGWGSVAPYAGGATFNVGAGGSTLLLLTMGGVAGCGALGRGCALMTVVVPGWVSGTRSSSTHPKGSALSIKVASENERTNLILEATVHRSYHRE